MLEGEAAAWAERPADAAARRTAVGSVILSGGLTDAVPLVPGTTVEVRTDRLGVLVTRSF